MYRPTGATRHPGFCCTTGWLSYKGGKVPSAMASLRLYEYVAL